jgi:hypothetical protein
LQSMGTLLVAAELLPCVRLLPAAAFPSVALSPLASLVTKGLRPPHPGKIILLEVFPMKRAFTALACAGIALLPMQSLAESKSDLTGSELTGAGNFGAPGNTLGERKTGQIAAATGTKRGARLPERTSELNAIVEAQDKVLQEKLRSICRGC